MSSSPGPQGSCWLGKRSGGAGVQAFSIRSGLVGSVMHTSQHPCDGMVVQVEGDVVVHVGGLAVDPCVQSGFASGHEYVQEG